MPFTPPLTPQQFQNQIIVSGSFGGGTGPTGFGGGPQLRTQTNDAFNGQTDTHFQLTNAPTLTYNAGGAHAQSGGSLVSFTPDNNTHRCVYLPFFANNISSAIVPTVGVNHFFTDALSGCAIFIDEMTNGDLIVYHGNAMAQTPNQAAILANPDIARADSLAYYGAMTQMAQLHNMAMGQRAAGFVGAITPKAHLQRNVYMQCIDDEVARKEAQGRTNVDVAGIGTNVVGFKIGGLWQFWWQTWAILTYTRPKKAPKGWFGNRNQGIGAGKLLAAECFWHQ